MAAARQQGITHRDLKPDNLMMSVENRLKILDYGLAKFRHEMALEGMREALTLSMTEERKGGPAEKLSTSDV